MNNKTSLNGNKEKSEVMSSLWDYSGCSVNVARQTEGLDTTCEDKTNNLL